MIRSYEPEDTPAVVEMVKNSILQVACKDYTLEQVTVWAGNVSAEKWNSAVQNTNSLVAIMDEQIVGFANMDDTGYVDYLFVHEQFQRLHIASRLLEMLENQSASNAYTVYASITAKTFFEKHGYRVIRENIAHIQEEKFLNFYMCKNDE